MNKKIIVGAAGALAVAALAVTGCSSSQPTHPTHFSPDASHSAKPFVPKSPTNQSPGQLDPQQARTRALSILTGLETSLKQLPDNATAATVAADFDGLGKQLEALAGKVTNANTANAIHGLGAQLVTTGADMAKLTPAQMAASQPPLDVRTDLNLLRVDASVLGFEFNEGQ